MNERTLLSFVIFGIKKSNVQKMPARLMREGLSRHDAVHAIGSVLVGHIWGQTQDGGTAPPPGVAYEQELRTLTADSLRERYGESE